MATDSITISITIPQKVNKVILAEAKELGCSRSERVRHILMDHMQKEKKIESCK